MTTRVAGPDNGRQLELLEILVYRMLNYNKLLIDSMFDNKSSMFTFLSRLNVCFCFVTYSVVVENVAVLPSLLQLPHATVRLEAKGWASEIHAPANAELGATLLES